MLKDPELRADRVGLAVSKGKFGLEILVYNQAWRPHAGTCVLFTFLSALVAGGMWDVGRYKGLLAPESTGNLLGGGFL